MRDEKNDNTLMGSLEKLQRSLLFCYMITKI